MTEYPDWEHVCCFCHAGTTADAYGMPKEHDLCQGQGVFWRHKATGTLAMYPGGPLLGAHDRARLLGREVIA